MSDSQPNLANKKDTGRGSPRVQEIGHGMSFVTFWLGLPFPGWGLTAVLPVLLWSEEGL